MDNELKQTHNKLATYGDFKKEKKFSLLLIIKDYALSLPPKKEDMSTD